jgi:hypothetical protein
MGDVQTENNASSIPKNDSITAVTITQRGMWGVIAFAIPVLCWRWIAGAWPDWWYWGLCFTIGLVAAWLSPLVIVFWRSMRVLSYMHSPRFRLEHGSIWTEIEHIPAGGSRQLIRMEDGNILLLSVGVTTVIVYVNPWLGGKHLDPGKSDQLALFMVKDPFQRTNLSREARRQEDEKMLDLLRKAVGFPKSTEELKRTLHKLHPSIFGYQGYPQGYKTGTVWAQQTATSSELLRMQAFHKRLETTLGGEYEFWFWPEDTHVPWFELVKVIQDNKDLTFPAVAVDYWRTLLGEGSQQAANGDFLRGYLEGAVEHWARMQEDD